jgi:nicotinate-nucleotide pyrophosphorylase (carboxylating)
MPAFTPAFFILSIFTKISCMNAGFETNEELRQLLAFSLNEDVREGDHSSLSSIPPDKTNKAKLLVKDEGILAGVELAKAILAMVDPTVTIQVIKHDGERVTNGDIAFYLEGLTHSILKSERLILNFMQRLSGVATVTNTYVKAIEGTGCRLLDTRKTTPGLRLLEKWAVKVGGGLNHRKGLYDMIMLKDNHIDASGGIARALAKADAYRKSKGLDLKIEVETRTLAEVTEAVEAGLADRIMLDNFTPGLIREALAIINKRTETEASGGITLSNIRSYAETGVDFISVGALTHSVRSLDLSLKIVKE